MCNQRTIAFDSVRPVHTDAKRSIILEFVEPEFKNIECEAVSFCCQLGALREILNQNLEQKKY